MLEADKYLRLHLRAADDDEVEVTPAEFAAASAVHLMAPPPWDGANGPQLLASLLAGKAVCAGQRLGVPTLSGSIKVIEVERVQPSGIVRITGDATLHVAPFRETSGAASGTTYGDIGGLSDALVRIRELVEYPLRSPELFEHLGISVPRGIILYGPPGTGKTLIAKALATELGARFLAIQGPEIVSAYYGESERRLRAIFEEARTHAPAIIVMDELDSLAPRRERVHGDLEVRLVATLLSLLDGLSDLREVVVIGTTNRLEAVDPALRRPGRFEHEIHIGVPNLRGREEILGIHTRRMRLSGELGLQELARRTAGFVGADIASLCQTAGYVALRRVISPDALRRGDAAPIADVSVTPEDFEEALASVRPSALRELVVEIPADVTWDDIGGLDEIRGVMRENVVVPLSHPQRLAAVGVPPPHGVLLYGPPGTGKTLIARATASEAGVNFIPVRSPGLRAQWLSRGEHELHFAFRKAREAAPCILFLDEVDAIAATRGTGMPQLDILVSQLLAELDGIAPDAGVIVLAATNMVQLLDPALFRPGRFDCQVEVPLPRDDAARAAVFRVHTRSCPLAADVDLQELARIAAGLSGADIAEVCRRAGMLAVRGADRTGGGAGALEIRLAHFHEALVAVKHSGVGRGRSGQVGPSALDACFHPHGQGGAA